MNAIESPVSAPLFDKQKLFLKGVIIFAMALFLWLPTNLITNLVNEREERQKEAITDISSKWAGKQTVTGPVLVIPYNVSEKDDKGAFAVVRKTAYFLPEKLNIRSNIIPEKRYRGIYEVVVYRSKISISGNFGKIGWEKLNIPAENYLWNEAALLFSVKDNQKGLNEDVFIKWNDSSYAFNPQPPGYSNETDAFTAAVPMNADESMKDHSFSMDLSLNGSEQLLFAPTARDNNFEMRSKWSSPSFTGLKLPDTRTLTDSGFVANWKFLNRSTPHAWKDKSLDFENMTIGADLKITVDGYDKTLRSVKYSMLCIILTFAAFFLIETIYKRPLHFVQYALAGLALVLFYTLLLSISEYTGFNLAYLIAGVATVGLVAWYVGSIMHSGKLAMFISLVLVVVYSYIFTIIQLEDFALLMGSIGLFISLAIIMFFSRKLKWA